MNVKNTFLISILSVFILKILWNIYLHSAIDDLTKNSNNSVEVFNLSGYTYTKDQAEQACNFYNSTLASTDDLTNAYNNGADWCTAGWLSDSEVPKNPVQLNGACKSKISGILSHLPADNKAGVNCYGVKPIKSTDSMPIANFNSTNYSLNTGNKPITPFIPGFVKAISVINLLLSFIAVFIFYKYLNEIDNDKNTKYAMYSLFGVSIIIEISKCYVLFKPSEIINLNGTLRGLTASLSATYFFSLLLLLYVLKNNKINMDVELDTFKHSEFDGFDSDIDIDSELLDDTLELELNNPISKENEMKNKISELEKKLKEKDYLLEKNKERRIPTNIYNIGRD